MCFSQQTQLNFININFIYMYKVTHRPYLLHIKPIFLLRRSVHHHLVQHLDKMHAPAPNQVHQSHNHHHGVPYIDGNNEYKNIFNKLKI